MIDCKATIPDRGWTNLSQSSFHCIQSIFQGGCLTDDIFKPLALVLSTTDDPNQAFSFTKQRNHDFFATLANTHTVCHRYIKNSLEFKDSIEQLGRQKKIDLLVTRVHGSPLSQMYEKKYMSPYSPHTHFAALKSSLNPDATIMLVSCSNAATCGKDDFAGFIHSMAPPLATIYAPTQPADRFEIQSGAPSDIRFFLKGMDVTYRSGAGGYCNNPLDPDDMQEEKLAKRMDLLHPLVEQGQNYDAASSTTTEAFKSGKDWLFDRSIALFERLFDQGQGYEAAINAATEAFKSSKYWMFDRSIVLFERLFERGQYDAANSIAAEAVKSSNVFVQNRGINFFERLFDKGQGYEAAIGAAIETFKSSTMNIWISEKPAIDLFSKLFDKGQGYEAAIGAATGAFNSLTTNIGIREKPAIDLFSKLFDKGQGYEAAVGAATEAFNSSEFRIRKKAIDFFGTLFYKGQGYEAAIDAASEAFKSSNTRIRISAITLFEKLFDKGQGYEAAISAASEAFKSLDARIRISAAILFEKLFDKGQGYEAAISAANEAFKSSNDSIRDRGIDLCRKLIDKGKGVRECSGLYIPSGPKV